MLPFLRIPPFPGARFKPLAIGPAPTPLSDAGCGEVADLLRRERVGSHFWHHPLPLPNGRDILLAPADPQQGEQMLAAASAEGVRDRCVLLKPAGAAGAGGARSRLPTIEGEFDPWQLIASSEQLWVGADQELALVAAVLGKGLRTFGEGQFRSLSADAGSIASSVAVTIGSLTYASPFDGRELTAAEAICLLGEWRRLIEANQQLSAAAGIAAWKRPTVDPLLWDGGSGPKHVKRLRAASPKGRLAVWKSRAPAALLQRVEQEHWPVAEIEDGLIRGQGLGANCVPPLSIVLDSSGIYFDPSQPSDLETILQSKDFDPPLLERAAKLRSRILEAGISKYGGRPTERRRASSGRRVLVVGQVEDDRSILSGGKGQTNLELLQRARSMEADACIVYRPHPDVEAGHRKGHVPDDAVLQLADEIDRDGSIIDLISNVDEVHCITSLAGFEALLRGTPVTTHGVPFYAGWGLTRDLGDIPDRRTRRRTVDELIAASLIIYPRYLDPVTGLPCPPEVLVERIARGEERIAAPLAGIRKVQGQLKRAIRRVREVVA